MPASRFGPPPGLRVAPVPQGRGLPLVGRVWFRLFWQTYDHLGGWLLICLLSSALALPLVTAPLAWSALLYCAARAESGRDFSIHIWWEGVRHFAGRSLVMGLFSCLIPVLVWINLLFYMGAPFASALHPLARAVLVGLVIWLGVLGLLMLHAAWAFLVLQDLPLGKALRRGMLVVAAHPFAALMVAFTALPIIGLLAATGIGVVVMLGALLATLVMGFVTSTIEFHEEREQLAEWATLAGEPIQHRVRLQELTELQAAREKRYQRTFREILRPWDMR